MKTTPVGKHGLQLTRFNFVNCYLVREPDGYTLIDTMLPGSSASILAAAALRQTPIRRILLTHAHGDHVGSVDSLIGALPNLELAANQRSIPILKSPPDLSLEPTEPQGKIKGGTPGIKSQVTHVLTVGEQYGSLLVIDTPGHIPGQISLLDVRDGSLYAGDAILTIGGGLFIAGYANGWRSIFNNFTWDKPTALASAQRLTTYPIQRFATGHGPVLEGGPDILEAVIAKEK